MNRSVLQSPSVQPSMMIAGNRNPSCSWNINTPSLHPQPFPSNNNYFTTPPNLLPTTTATPPPSTTVASSWHGEFNYQDQLPPAESWRQLLMGDEEDKSGLGKKLENWEEHASNNLVYGHGSNNNNNNNNNNNWSQMMLLSSPKSSCITNNSLSNNNMMNFSSKKLIEISRQTLNRPSECNRTVIGGAAKKARVQPCSTQATFKVRKEKLGDRVTALHQIVSPFGKTDTASVLLEAIGYIRFLHGQIEALSLPYFGNETGTIKNQHPIHQLQGERNSFFPDDPGQLLNDHCTTKKRKGAPSHQGESDEEVIINKDLKSRGLCLVPVSCTMQVENNNIINGADYWTCNFQN